MTPTIVETTDAPTNDLDPLEFDRIVTMAARTGDDTVMLPQRALKVPNGFLAPRAHAWGATMNLIRRRRRGQS